MYLQKFEIQGFKSFANKTTLEFNRELTAIVGPNGSGKSNISDAVRWVLGEQSLKVLRGKKSQDVIFAGSDQKSRLGFAEVNLHLNNEDGRAPIDYSEVVITRRIYRDGENEYLINKNKVRLQDVQMLMAKSNFGQKSYSIVGQGMVDTILTSSPLERKEFFDEATGVRQYQIKREQSLNKMEKAHENLQQSRQLVQEIEPRLRSLTRQMKRLEEKEEIGRELHQLQTQYYSHLSLSLKKDLTTRQRDFEINEQLRRDLEDKMSLLQVELDKIESEDTRNAAFQAVETKYSELVNQKNKSLQEISLLQGKMDLELAAAGQNDLLWLRKKSQTLGENLTDIERQLNTGRQEAKQWQSQWEIKSQEQRALVEDFSKLRDQLASLRQERGALSPDKIRNRLAHLRDTYESFISQLAVADTPEKVVLLKEKAKDIQTIINSLSTELESGSLPDADHILDLENKLQSFLTSKDNLVDEVNNLKLKHEISRQEVQQLTQQLAQVQTEKSEIDRDIALQESGDLSEQKKVLLEKKKSLEQELSGIEGSLELVKSEIENFNNQSQAKQDNLIRLQKQVRELQNELNQKTTIVNDINIQVAKLETKFEDLENEIAEEIGSDFTSQSTTEPVADLTALRDRINSLKNKAALIGGIDNAVPQEFEEVKERFEFLDSQISDLQQSIDHLREVVKELDQQIDEQFRKNFSVINEEFQKYFKVLFNGGKASLIMRTANTPTEEENETEEKENDETDSEWIKNLRKSITVNEIEIKACPPGKKIDSINTLSGGEKAMTAIALICAIIYANPSPFVFLDEVDAALDEANAARYVAIINELSSRTQFIAVTHNRVTMHHAAILYGVTMGSDGVSKLLSVNLREAEEKYGK
ncbi:MAG: AAA family ATPase [Candidatus Komeilibacteria bacterium]|nr:AAA family ATPase [Candidatus Komeilibacteria bacterium]